MIDLGELEADAGDLREPPVGGQPGAPGPGSATGRRRRRPPGGRDRGEGGHDLVVQLRDCRSSRGCGPGAAGSASGGGRPGSCPPATPRRGAAALDAAVGEGGQGGRVASPAASASRIARAVLVRASDETALDSLARAPSRSFSSRATPGSGPGQRSRVRVRSRSARICRRRHDRGRSSPISASRAIHCASSRSVFGRPASCRACDGLASCTSARRPPAGSTRSASSPTSPPSPPARPGGQQPRRHAQIARRGRRDASRPRPAAAAVAGRRQPPAHVAPSPSRRRSRRLSRAGAGILVLDHLRGDLPRPRVAHPGPQREPVERRAARGPRSCRLGPRSRPTCSRPQKATLGSRSRPATRRARVPRNIVLTGSQRHLPAPPAPQRPNSPAGSARRPPRPRRQTAPASGRPAPAAARSPDANSRRSATAVPASRQVPARW